MREIKFRAWDKLYKRMRSHEDIGSGLVSMWDRFMVDKIAENENGQYAPLMQYTGLKDKNGVEIYEGDILIDRCTEVIQQVIWGNRGWNLKDEDGFYCSTFFLDDKEIIGNIYENHELLEGGVSNE